MYELVNIFEVFLPQLLQDPNPKDPLNGEAAQLLLKDPEKYKGRVKEYVKKYAVKDISANGMKKVIASNGNGEESKSVHSELSNASDNYESDGKND